MRHVLRRGGGVKIFRPRGVRIAGTGAYLPARVVTNADLVALGAPLTDEEMVKLSGIRARHWAAGDEATSDLAARAGRAALATAGVDAARVERLIVATVSPDHSSPSAACFAHAALGLGRVPALDLTASCSGFLYALETAARAVDTGEENVLAVAADIRSRFVDVKDRATCALFGDGAGAALITRGNPDEGLLAIATVADGSGARSVFVPGGGSRDPAGPRTIRMAEGPQVYFSAVEGMVQMAESLLAGLDLTWDAIDLLVPHQANKRIVDRVRTIARLPEEKVVVNIDRTGNISGATVGVALDEALRAGRARAGSRLLLLSAGAGYTAGAALYRVDEALAARYR
jgi:3-oxoacyl-[acyl-carrier-protein] synthase-3